MKIFDEHGTQIGEIEKPGPVEKDGVWYEAVDVRPIPDGKGEWYVPLGGWSLQFSRFSRKPVWIMRPIPRATPEQLKAIGMKERDDRPVECKVGDTVWHGLTFNIITANSLFIGKPRWVLEDVPVAKEPAHTGVCKQCGKPVVFGKDGCCNNGHELCADCWDKADHNCPVCLARYPARAPVLVKEKELAHTSCEGCYWELNGHGSEERHHTCFTCHSLDNGSQEERKNYTPAPAPEVTDAQEDKFSKVVDECFKLGMGTNGIQVDPEDVVAFILSLAQRAGEGYSIPEIEAWLKKHKKYVEPGRWTDGYNFAVLCLIDQLNSPQDGIKAVTDRNRKDG